MNLSVLKPYGLAALQVVVTSAAYLIPILTPDGDLGDVTFVQWLGLIVFDASAFGITQRARNTNPAED